MDKMHYKCPICRQTTDQLVLNGLTFWKINEYDIISRNELISKIHELLGDEWTFDEFARSSFVSFNYNGTFRTNNCVEMFKKVKNNVIKYRMNGYKLMANLCISGLRNKNIYSIDIDYEFL